MIQHDVVFAKLGLAVVDEQHRFGVAQRLALRDKLEQQALEPHLLMMSATPIPRTLAMTYFADLAVSTIDELPPGRTPVLTKLFADGRRDEVIARIRDEVAQGKQVYWVCPLIEEIGSARPAQRHRNPPAAERGAARRRRRPAARAPARAREGRRDVRNSPAARCSCWWPRR